MRKRSNIILAIIFLSASVGLGIYANHIRSTTEQRPARVSRAVEIEEGERFSRESNVSYKHLHVDYPVSIDGRYEDHVELSGIAIASDMVHYNVRQDTLYIQYSDDHPVYRREPDSFAKKIGVVGKVAVTVHVGGVGLRSITVGKRGSIRPTREEDGGFYRDPVYRDDEKERYTLTFDTLDIVNGPVNIRLVGRVLNLTKIDDYTRFDLEGQAEHVNVNYDGGGSLNLNGYNLKCNTASVNTENNKSGTVIGNIQLSVQDTLLAKLYGTMNVLYQGDPEVIKYERSTGRVVHMFNPNAL